jgi:hypothetical protein
MTIYRNRIKKSIDNVPASKLRDAFCFIEFLAHEKETLLPVTNEKKLILSSAGLWKGETEGIEYEDRLRNRWTERLEEN